MKAVYSKIARRLWEGSTGKDTQIKIRGIEIERQQLKRFMRRELEKAQARQAAESGRTEEAESDQVAEVGPQEWVIKDPNETLNSSW